MAIFRERLSEATQLRSDEVVNRLAARSIDRSAWQPYYNWREFSQSRSAGAMLKRNGTFRLPRSRVAVYSGLVFVPILWWTAKELCVEGPIPNQQAEKPARARPSLRSGKRTFESTCATCHGLDGRGGEHGPGIAANRDVQALSDGALAEVIRTGVPAKGMPSFGFVGESEIAALVRYIRVLGSGQPKAVRGEPALGERLFFGKAGCSECHMVAGRGGFIGSDLSQFALTHSAEEIRQAILKPGSAPGLRGQLVSVETRDGSELRGLVRNEDNFSIQLLSTDGSFHSLAKQEIRKLTRDPNPLMPSDFGVRLTTKELNNVISYLAAVTGSSKTRLPAAAGREKPKASEGDR